MAASNKRDLIERARREHDCNPGLAAAELAAAELALGCRLPDDLRDVLAEINGARFWGAGDFAYRLLPASEIKPVKSLLEVSDGPDGFLAVLEVSGSGDYVALDVDPASPSFGRLLDCFHETFPFELHRVCNTMWELLDLVLGSAGDEWLWPAVLRYGVDFASGRTFGG